MKTPEFHFDFILQRFPEGRQLYEMIRHSHRNFSLSELAGGRCSRFLAGIDDETTRIANHLMMLYDRFGQNSYVIGPKVQDLFSRTDLSKVTPDAVFEPQTAFYIALPNCPWRVWGGERTRWHQLSGVYVGFTKTVDRHQLEALGYDAIVGVPPKDLAKLRYERTVHLALWGGPNEVSVCETDDALLWYSMNLDAWGRDGSNLEAYFEHQAIMLTEEEDRSEWLGFDPLGQGSNLSTAPDEADVDEHRRTCTAVLRLAFNLCLYLNTDEPDLDHSNSDAEARRLKKEIAQKKSGGKRKKLERRLENLPKTRIVYVGPLFEQLASSMEASSSSSGGTHASPLEHAVRPHWQRYWTGSGDQKKPRWTLKGMYVRGTGQPVRTITKLRE